VRAVPLWIGRQQPIDPAQVIAISKAQLSEDMAEPAEVAAHAAPAPCRRDFPRPPAPSAHAIGARHRRTPTLADRKLRVCRRERCCGPATARASSSSSCSASEI
jgi:hypothetical protein